MRSFIVNKLEKATDTLDLSGVTFSNDEFSELIAEINNKSGIKTLVLENSAISSLQAGILATLTHVTSINLDRNDIGFSTGFKELCMNPTILYLNFNRNALNTKAASFLLNDLERADLTIAIQDGNKFTFEEKRQITRKYDAVADETTSLSSAKKSTFKHESGDSIHLEHKIHPSILTRCRMA